MLCAKGAEGGSKMAVALTPEQVEIFNRRLATYGISMDDLAGRDVHTGSGGGARFLCGHPDAGPDHAGEIRTVADIASMKELGGVPDSHYVDDGIGDGHIDYPPAPPQAALTAIGDSGGDLCTLLDTLDPDTIADSRRAMRAYLLGNSAKAAAWEPMLNALSGPAPRRPRAGPPPPSRRSRPRPRTAAPSAAARTTRRRAAGNGTHRDKARPAAP